MDTKEKVEENEKADIELKYKELLNDVKTNPFFKTNIRICNYACDECKFVVRTIKQDKGVVPSSIKCIRCEEYAHSIGAIGGNTGIYDIAWYRPPFDVFNKLKKEVQRHILLGGLIPNPNYKPSIPYTYKTKNQKKRYRRKINRR